MKEKELEQLEEWHKNHEFEKIVRYIDLLRQPSYEHLSKKASALNNLRRYYQAIEVLESVRPEGENDADWHYRYGYALICIEQFAMAEQHLLKSVQLNAKKGDAWYLLSLLYHDYMPDEEKEKLVNEKLEHVEILAEELRYDHFMTGQIFNIHHQLLSELEFDSVYQKEFIIDNYKKLIDALEHVVTDNEQIPLLVIALATTIKDVMPSHHNEFDEFPIYLSNELGYILNWFGVEPEFIERVMYIFSYTLMVYKDIQFDVQPQHLYQLLMWMEQKEYQKIVDLFFALPLYQQSYAYAEWLIQGLIYLKEYERAEFYLDTYSEYGEKQAYWHYWYASVHANLARFEQAKTHLLQAVELDKYNRHAWLLLEDVYLRGLNDILGANWARQQREQIEDEEEQ